MTRSVAEQHSQTAKWMPRRAQGSCSIQEGEVKQVQRDTFSMWYRRFHHPVALRMVSGGPVELRPEGRGHPVPEGGCELGSVVTGWVMWHAETCDPVEKESIHTGLSGSV